MTNTIHYLIVKEKDKKSITYFKCSNLKGFNMTPKNKNIKLKDAINVNKMVIINPTLIEKLVNKKISLKLKKLIDLIINIYDSDDDPGSSMMIALNEVERFKREMLNKYLEFLNKEQLKDLDKKIKFLEQEVTVRAYYLNERISYEDNYETKKSR
ncbi:MAG: hypothetical protein IJ501_03140 [Bacilli bacterium]|nr:hypothetical protein [Bacilli bacterium]